MNAGNPIPNPTPGGDAGRNRLAWFEKLLKESSETSHVDWAGMERRLLDRIWDAEGEGRLVALKADEIPPGDFYERLEGDLFARIRNHHEYQEPVDDVISTPEGLSPAHWQRLESKLEERIQSVCRLSPLDCAFKADQIASSGRWEAMEAGLEKRIAALEGLEPWELALKNGNILPAGRWDALEEKLESRIDRQRKLNALSTQPIWLGLGFYLSRAPVRMALGFLFAAGLIMGSLRVYQERFRPIETLIYQAQGTSAGDLDSALASGSLAVVPGHPAVQAKEDGAMVMVNKRGFVDMRNGSRLEIQEASKAKVHYKVAFSGQGRKPASGNVTFFVNKAKGREKFLVSTPDYRIEVLGTYFRVDPDLGGRFSTAVLEGKVRIRSKQYGDFTVEAGESLVYDAVTGRYRILEGGRTVPREEIEIMPGMDELLDFGILSVTSDIPRAEVRIDGRYRGVTPLVVLLSPGPHSLHLSQEGHAAHDTMVTVREGATSRMTAALAALETESVQAAPTVKPSPSPAAPAAPARKIPEPDSPAEPVEPVVEAPAQDEGPAQIFHRADEAQAKDWRMAVVLYAKVLEHPDASGMRKEAAQFSIARLRADHEEEKSRAKEDFLRYLALYPDGAFAGESWMRLAELEVGRNPDKAIEYYLRCIGKFPRHHRLAELQHRVGLIYLQNGRYDEAVAMFRQSLGNVLYNSESERRRIHGSLYRAYLAKGDVKNAELIGEQLRLAPEKSKFR